MTSFLLSGIIIHTAKSMMRNCITFFVAVFCGFIQTKVSRGSSRKTVPYLCSQVVPICPRSITSSSNCSVLLCHGIFAADQAAAQENRNKIWASLVLVLHKPGSYEIDNRNRNLSFFQTGNNYFGSLCFLRIY